jgi:hypothetical protein
MAGMFPLFQTLRFCIYLFFKEKAVGRLTGVGTTLTADHAKTFVWWNRMSR